MYEKGSLSQTLFGLPPTKQTAEAEIPKFLVHPSQDATQKEEISKKSLRRSPKDQSAEETSSRRKRRKVTIDESNKSQSIEDADAPKKHILQKRTKAKQSHESETDESAESNTGQRSSHGTAACSPQLDSSAPDPVESTNDAAELNARPIEELKRTLCLRNVPVEAKAKHIYKFLNLKVDLVDSVRFRNVQVDPKFAKKKIAGIISKAYLKNATKSCYIVLKDAADMEKLLLLNGSPWTLHSDNEERPIFIDKAPLGKKFSLYDKRCTVFVGRLPKSADEAKLMKWFGTVGKIKHVRIIRDPRTQISKGFGFVCYENKSAVPQAIRKFSKFEIDGHPLRVTRPLTESEAQDQKERRASKKKASTKGKQVSKGKKPVKDKSRSIRDGAARRVAYKNSKKIRQK